MSLLKNTLYRLQNCYNSVKYGLFYRSISAHQYSKLKGNTQHMLKEKPKRPVNSFLVYSHEQLPLLREKFPNKKQSDLLKVVSEQWKGVEENKKTELKNKYNAELQKYVKDLEVYQRSLTAADKKMIQDFRENIQEKKEKLRLKKMAQQMNKPKAPGSAYIIYVKENLKTLHKTDGVKQSETVMNLAKNWNNLSESEKDKYYIQYTKLHEQYQKDLINWENKMKKEGHTELVRAKPTK